MPRSASSKRPLRRATAPVKAPFSCPNSSASSRVSGRAAQLTVTRLRRARSLQRWIAAANTSLPVPLSPVIRIVALLGAACCAIATARRIGSLRPMMSAVPCSSSSLRRSRRFSVRRFCFSRALRTTFRVVEVENGFSMKS